MVCSPFLGLIVFLFHPISYHPILGVPTESSAAAGDAPEDDGDGAGSDGGGGGGDYGGDSDEGETPSWKKTIMIGPSYQASVPTGLSSYGDDTLPYGESHQSQAITEKESLVGSSSLNHFSIMQIKVFVIGWPSNEKSAGFL